MSSEILLKESKFPKSKEFGASVHFIFRDKTVNMILFFLKKKNKRELQVYHRISGLEALSHLLCVVIYTFWWLENNY